MRIVLSALRILATYDRLSIAQNKADVRLKIARKRKWNQGEAVPSRWDKLDPAVTAEIDRLIMEDQKRAVAEREAAWEAWEQRKK